MELIWRIAGNNKSHWFEANNNSGTGYYPSVDACYTVAVLCILRRLHVLPPIKQHLSSLFLPFSPSKPYIVAHRLYWDHYHDHHIIFSSNLLHFSMWSTMALCLPWWNHSSRLVHHCNTVITNLVNWQISCISSSTLFFNGALWHSPWNPCCNCQLVYSASQRHSGLRICHGYILFDRDNVLCLSNSREVETWMVWLSRA